MHTVFALLCFVVVIRWLIFPYPPGLLCWHCGNLTIAPVPAKQPWWIWINTSCEFTMNDCITTTKQSTTKPCAYFLGYTVEILYIDVKACMNNYIPCVMWINLFVNSLHWVLVGQVVLWYGGHKQCYAMGYGRCFGSPQRDTSLLIASYNHHTKVLTNFQHFTWVHRFILTHKFP